MKYFSEVLLLSGILCAFISIVVPNPTNPASGLKEVADGRVDEKQTPSINPVALTDTSANLDNGSVEGARNKRSKVIIEVDIIKQKHHGGKGKGYGGYGGYGGGGKGFGGGGYGGYGGYGGGGGGSYGGYGGGGGGSYGGYGGGGGAYGGGGGGSYGGYGGYGNYGGYGR